MLDTRFTHHIARLVVSEARVVQHVVAHLADVTDQVGGKAIAGIQPPLFVDGFQLRQLVAVGLDKLHLVRSDVLLERNRLILGRQRVMRQGALQLLRGHVQPTRNQGKVRTQVAARFADQEAGDGGIIVHQQTAFAVEQLAPRSQDGHLADAILLRQRAVVLRSDDLQPPQAGEQYQQDGDDRILHDRQLERR